MIDVFNHVKKLLSSETTVDAVIVLGSSIVSSLLGFIFIFIIARKLGPTQFGVFSTVINYTTFLAAIVDLGLSLSLVRFVNKAKPNERVVWLSTGLIATTLFSSLLSLLFSLIYYYYLRNIWHHQEEYTFFVFLIILFVALNTYLLALFQAIKQFIKRSIVDISFSIFRLVIIGILTTVGVLSVINGLISVAGGYLLAIGLALIIARRYLNLSSVNQHLIPQMLKFSRWLAGANLFANLYGRLDVLMLAWLTTAYATGIYASAARFITIFPLVVSSLSAVVSPRFAHFESLKELKDYFRSVVGICLIVSLGMLGLIVLAQPIIVTAYTREFIQAVPLFQWLVIANIPLVLSVPATNAIVYYFHRPHIITYVAAIQLTGLIILNYLLIPEYYAFGPVYSLIVMNTLGALLQYGVYFRLEKGNDL